MRAAVAGEGRPRALLDAPLALGFPGRRHADRPGTNVKTGVWLVVGGPADSPRDRGCRRQGRSRELAG